MMNNYLEEINRCIECKQCESSCPIYLSTGKQVDTPHCRLQIAKKIFHAENLSPEEFQSIYNCPKCEKCQNTCSSEIEIVKIVGMAREELFKQGYKLLPEHQGLRNGILERKNSVKGDPAKLLEYLPEHFEFDEGTKTLYFAGCLSGYFLKSIANSSVRILQKIGIPFKVIKDEICCGSPLMDLGDKEGAKDLFNENLVIFKDHDIEELIVSCSGCYRCFTKFYPEVVGESVKVRHIVDVIAEALKKGKIKFNQLNTKVIYHDPCHLSREFGKYESPREILKSTCELIEFLNNRQDADCCGANSAVRAGFRDLSVQVALRRIDQAIDKADILITSCPFCTFNLNYACKKNNREIQIRYMTEFLLNALE